MNSWNNLAFLVFSGGVSTNYDQDCRSAFFVVVVCFVACSYGSFQKINYINIEKCSHFDTLLFFPICVLTFGVENV